MKDAAPLSPPALLSRNTLERIVASLHLEENLGADGGPLLRLPGPGGQEPVGAMRVFGGASLQRMVTVSIVFAPAQLDSHMIFAFGKPPSGVPHFTLDAVAAGGSYAFHLDLIPRVDVGAHLAYVDTVLHPLTPAWEAARKIPGLSPAQLSPRQLGLMSPWMLACRADEAAFAKIDTPVQAYLDHWLQLVEQGIPEEALEGTTPEERKRRDARNRAILFSPQVDPVWNQVAGLIGADNGEIIRRTLREVED